MNNSERFVLQDTDFVKKIVWDMAPGLQAVADMRIEECIIIRDKSVMINIVSKFG